MMAMTNRIFRLSRMGVAGVHGAWRYGWRTQKRLTLYRILGNDLPPRHVAGQTRDNLEAILKLEPPLIGTRKVWVINRVVDADEESRMLDILQSRRLDYIHFPPDRELLREKSRPLKLLTAIEELNQLEVRDIMQYVTHINEARNHCIRDAVDRNNDWALPLDGSCLFNYSGWLQMLAAFGHQEDLLMIPMLRLTRNAEYHPWRRRHLTQSEPKVAIRCQPQPCYFDERRLYAMNDKLDLIRRYRAKLGQDRFSALFHGYVYRLSSGDGTTASEGPDMEARRQQGVINLVNRIIREMG